MARGRELWLIFRARNQASSQLRAAARDIKALAEGPRDMQVRGEQLAIRAARIQEQSLRNQARIASIMNEQGTRKLALESQAMNVANQELAIRGRLAGMGLRQQTLDIAREKNINRIWDLEYRIEQARKRSERFAESSKITIGPTQARVAGRFAKLTDPRVTAYTAETGRLNHQLEKLERELRVAQMESGTFAERQAALGRAEEELNAALARNAVEAQRVAAAQGAASEEALALARTNEILARQLKLVQRAQEENTAAAAGQRTETLSRLSSTFRNAGRSMSLYGTITLGVLGMMSKGYADFATDATRAATQVNEVTGRGARGVAQVGQYSIRIQKTVMDQMKQFPASAHDMTQTLYDIYSSMRISFGAGERLLTVFNKAWVAGGMVGNLEDVSHALITLGNNWGINANNMNAWAKLASSTLATVRYGRLNLEQYTQTLNQLAPAFRSANQPIEQVNAALAFTTKLLPSQRFTATALARLVEQLNRAAKPLREQFGTSITDASGNLLHLDKVMQILIKRFPQLVTSSTFRADFFKMLTGTRGTIQAQRALTGLALHQKMYQQTVHDTIQDVDELNRSYAALARAPGVRFQVFINQLKVISYEIGAAMLPVFEKLSTVVRGLEAAWNSLSPSTRRLISQFAGWGAAITIVLGLLTTMVGVVGGSFIAWKTFAEMLGTVRAAMIGVEGAEIALAAETGLVAPEILAIGAALVIALPLLVKYHDRIFAMLDPLGRVKDALMTSFPVRSLLTLIHLTVDIVRFTSALLHLWEAFRNSKKNLNDAGKSMGSFGSVVTGVVSSVQHLVHWWGLLEKLPPVKLAVQFITSGLPIPGMGGGRGPSRGSAADWLKKATGWVQNPFGGIVYGAEAGLKGLTGVFNREADKIVKNAKEKSRQTRSDFDRMRAQAAQRASHLARGEQRRAAGLDPRGLYTQRTFIEEMRRLARFNKAIETAPNMAARIRAIVRYNDELARAARTETKNQKKAQDQILQALEQNMGVAQGKARQWFNQLRQLQAQFRVAPTMSLANQIQKLQDKMQALSPAQQAFFQQLEQNLGEVKVVSDRAVLAMARNVDRLRRAFERTPSVVGYQRWYRANKQYTRLATQDQQQFANDMVQFNREATQKIQEQFSTVLNYVRSLYQQFFEQLKSQFGQLAQGPYADRLNEQVQRIRDAGSKKAQALRDQADAIEESASNAEKKISATEGNLIDWGLRLDTSKLEEASAKARAKRLRDRADEIEKRANRRADAEEKRLREHRLRPKELIADLRAQVKAFERWQNELGALAKRGAPQELIDQLQQLGPEYEPVVRSILHMTNRQFRTYTRLFNRGQRDIHRAAMRQLRTHLKEYERYGRNVVDRIAKGIIDEKPAVTKALRQITHGILRGTHIRIRHGRVNMHLQARPLENVMRHTARNAGRNTTQVRHNSHQLQTHARRIQTNSQRVQRNSTQLQRNTTALNNNTKALNRHHETQRAHARRHPAHTDPRRHQNPPTAHYHYHADKSHHMSADQYFRKMHFRHRNQRRC